MSGKVSVVRPSGVSREKGKQRQVTNTPPTGIVTFLFTDIEGSASLWEKHPYQMEDVLARHDQILRTTIEDQQGYVFMAVGDAFCATFATATDALKAALAAQRSLFVERWPEPLEVPVRMALHTGAAEELDGKYFGPALNRVARLMSAGHDGQILLSGVTYNLVRDHLVHLEPEAELRYMGEHRVRGLRQTEHIFQLVVPDLPKDFPPLKTDGLVAAGLPKETREVDFQDRYRFIRHLGMGLPEAFLAHDEVLDRDVAIKALRSDSEHLVEHFKREAEITAALYHPNIVSIYEWGRTEDGNYYMAMEYVPGGTLKECIERESLLPPAEAVALTLQVAQALRVAHECGVIHWDIPRVDASWRTISTMQGGWLPNPDSQADSSLGWIVENC
jgi:class 3 adenylate cyclase